MTWTPANNTAGQCFTNYFTYSCQPSFLTFLTFITQYLGHSADDKYRYENQIDEEYDFVIVGAGSAGCVVANRLSEIGNWKVLLIEAGDEQPLVTSVPGLLGLLAGSSIDYEYPLHQDESKCKRGATNLCLYPRGKVMGGTSSINGMIYNRGHKEDYDDWERQGNPGWSWQDVLPYFKKSENLRTSIPGGNLKNHGIGGYLGVELRKREKYSEVLINAWKELGLKEVDYNSGEQLGVAKMQYTMKDGVRQSTNDAFIRPIRDRRYNLTVRPKTQATKIIIDPQTKRAFGVEYVTHGSKVTKRVFARKEVIVSAGAVESPKLLMLSGIGKAKDLREAGIEVIQDLSVGENYQDHFVTNALTFVVNNAPTEFGPSHERIDDILRFTSYRRGPFSISGGVLDNTAYFQTPLEKRPGLPDIEIFYFNAFQEESSDGEDSAYIATPYRNRFFMYAAVTAPKSRGYVKLNSTDPLWSKPILAPNFNENPADIDTMVEGMKQAKKVSQTRAFRNGGLEATHTPAPLCEDYKADDEKYFRCVAKQYPEGLHHPCGTCKMGPASDPDAVVDARLRVHGIQGLRVIDASIIPTLPRANTNAATIMIGEKGSDLIKEEWLYK